MVNQAEFERELDVNISRLVDSYRTLLKKSMVEEDSMSRHEDLQCATASASIIHHAQRILDQIAELRMQIVLKE
jgi:hypothetical protein